MSQTTAKYFCFLIGLLLFQGFSVRGQEGFVPNEGQWEGNFEMRAAIKSGYIYLEKNGITWLLYNSDSLNKIQHQHYVKTVLPVHVVKSKFVNANPNPVIEHKEKTVAYFNYFLGKDPTKWKTGLHGYKEVIYKEIYPKTDLQILYNEAGIKYNLIVKAGGNPEDIKIQYEGADKLEVTRNGFEITTSLGMMQEFPPYVYQEIGETQEFVPSEFVLNDNVLGFKLNAKFRRRHNLIIDPVLVFSTYSGSRADNFGFTATYDLGGNGYAGGTVYNFEFPTSTGAYQVEYKGGVAEIPTGAGRLAYPARDCGIHKYSEDGTQLLFGTFLGGTHNEQPHSMVVNSQNQLVVFGSTRSRDFPMTHNHLTYDPSAIFIPEYNIFVTVFNPNGTAIVSSALIGGAGDDGINGDLTKFSTAQLPLLRNFADDFRGEVMVDENDNVYVASSTNSADFPIVGGFLTTHQPPQSGVVIKLNENLSSILWSSYIGGTLGTMWGYDAAFGVALGTDNDVFVAGGTDNGSFFSALGGHKKIMSGNQPDGYIVRINRETAELMDGTLVGTDQYDQCFMVKTDKEGYPYVFGQTTGNFPVTGEVYNNAGASQFIAKYEKDLKSVVFSTTVGSGRSSTDISPTAFLVDVCGKIYVSGWGGQTNRAAWGFSGGNTQGMPVTADAFQKTTDGSDFWLAVFSKDMKGIIYGTYIGGITAGNQEAHEHVDGGTSRFDERGVIYHSVCAGCGGNSLFPTTDKAHSETNNSRNCNNALFKFDMDAQNKPPVVRDTFLTVMVTETLHFSYFGTDPDKEDRLTLSFNSEYIGGNAPAPHILVATNSAYDTVRANFTWKPACEHLTGDTIKIRVRIKDTGCPASDSAFATIKILVTEPPLATGPDMLCLDFLGKNQNEIKWERFETGPFFAKVHLIRRNPDNSLHLIKTLTNGEAGFVLEDMSLDLRNNNYCYFVVTENICGRTDTLDYKICSKDEFESPIVGSQLITATVPDNENVQVVWSKSTEDDFRSYRLFRGQNIQGHIAWTEIAEITSIDDTVYTDSKVDVSKQSFCYCLQVTDKCGHISDTSNIGCNIVLKGVSERWYFDLDWNPYRNWNTGVEEYVLRRSVDTGVLRPIVAVNQSTHGYRDSDLDYWWGGYYYHVEAYQQPDTNERFTAVSSSNKIYLIQPPLLHVPTAFSPNGDGSNDIWGFVPVFVREFNIKVFNRWGEKVFETDNKANQWDGTFMSDNPFDNVFIWVAIYKGWDNSFHKQQGTVTVLK